MNTNAGRESTSARNSPAVVHQTSILRYLFSEYRSSVLRTAQADHVCKNRKYFYGSRLAARIGLFVYEKVAAVYWNQMCQTRNEQEDSYSQSLKDS